MEQVGVRTGSFPRWFILAVISTAYIAVMSNIQGFKAMLPQVEAEFAISGAQAGLYPSFYFLSATLIALFSGKVVDNLGPKKGLVIGVGMVGGMIVLHSFAPFFGVILGLAFLTGVGFSIITPSLNKGVLEVVEPGKRALSMGLTHSGGGVGALLGASLLPFLGENFGWRPALMGAGIFALCISLFIFKFYRRGEMEEASNPESGVSSDNGSNFDSNSSSENRGVPASTLKGDLLLLLRDRYLLSICLMGLVFGTSISSITGHFALFLNQDLGFSPFLAGLGLSFFHLGGIFGQPGWGLVNDRLFRGDRRRGLFLLGILSAAMAVVVGTLASYGEATLTVVLTFSLLLGLFVLGIPGIYFTAVSELAPADKTGVATSLALIFIRAGVILSPPLFGVLSDWSGDYTYSWVLLGLLAGCLTLVSFYLSGKFADTPTISS